MRAAALGLVLVLWGMPGSVLRADEVTVAGRTYERFEFPLSDGTCSVQLRPSVAWSLEGNSFTATWDTQYVAYARRFTGNGDALTPDIRIGSGGQSETWYTDVAALPGGASMVVTESHPSSYIMDIYARAVAADGSYLTDFFPVNTYTSGSQKSPRIGADATGNFLIVWRSYWPTGDDYEIVGRQFDAAGHPLGDDFLVNTSLTGKQTWPSVAMNPDGQAMVVWSTAVPTGGAHSSSDIRARLFGPSGDPLGDELIVSAAKSGISSGNTDVAVNAPGQAVVTWEESPHGSADSHVYVQRYEAFGQPVGDPIRVTDHTYWGSLVPKVGLWDNGEFVVTWDDSEGLWARLFDAGGDPLGDPFAVSIMTEKGQLSPHVACGPDGRMAFMWYNDFSAQSYATVYVPEPATLSLLAAGALALLRRKRASEGKR